MTSLLDPHMQEPGLWQSLKEAFLGYKRPLDCIQVEVTSICPGRCTYCPHTTMAPSWLSRHMKAETFKALWPLMLQSRRVHLQGWGEPLLHPLFFDFARLARKAGCRVSSTTCGLRMDEAVAEQLADSGIDILAFSLVGTDEASNAPRAGVSFARVCEAIHTLQQVRKKRMAVHLEVHLAYLMLASSLSPCSVQGREAIRALPKLMESLNIHAAVVSTLDYIAAPGLEQEAFAPHETHKIATARTLLTEIAIQARALGRDFHYALPDPTPAPQCREHARSTVYVDADGRVSPCIYLNLPTTLNDPRRRVFGQLNNPPPCTDTFPLTQSDATTPHQNQGLVNNQALNIWQQPDFTAFRDALATPRPDAACVNCAKRFEQPGA